MTPDLATPFGYRLVKRSLQVCQTAIALNGTPCAAASHAWAAPYEMPHAPICRSFTSGRAANCCSSARRSAISRAPANVTKPPDSPWPRRS